MHHPDRNGKDYALISLRGVAMGAADVVPGVSGGTVAFITGIYEELLNSIRAITPSTVKLLFTEGVAAFWVRINGSFLLALVAGIGFSIFSLARAISYALEAHPILVWSFFFGLILYSAWFVGRRIGHWTPSHFVGLLIGTGVAWWITVLSPAEAALTPLNIFLAGALAICAMILPGISGSFILLLLGMYTHVIGAIKGLDLALLGLFVAGCLVGLLSFSHILGWLLDRYHWGTLSVLTGFMIGSLNKIWPWKETLSWRTNSDGEQVPLMQSNVLPAEYAEISGEPSMLLGGVICMLAGIALVWSIEHIADRSGSR